MAWCLRIAFALVLSACGSEDDGLQCAAGTERCACYPNATCNAGLTCTSRLCVDLREFQGSASKVDPVMATTPPVQDTSTVQRSPASVPSVAGAAAPPPTANAPASGLAGGSAPRVECKQDCSQVSCGPDPVCQRSCGECESGFICEAGACRAPAPLRRNGDTCADDEDCASNICGRNRAGERLCYGRLTPNEPCRDTFDCVSGACIEMVEGEGSSVCVDGLNACDELGLIGTCTAALAVAACQHGILCGDLSGDFNSCIRHGCTYWHDNPPTNGCESQLSFSRGGKQNCSKP